MKNRVFQSKYMQLALAISCSDITEYSAVHLVGLCIVTVAMFGLFAATSYMPEAASQHLHIQRQSPTLRIQNNTGSCAIFIHGMFILIAFKAHL